MESMIERVAMAIAECQQELGADKWRYCLPEARAAITAMREPSRGMAVAGANENASQDAPSAVGTYSAMIDAALSE